MTRNPKQCFTVLCGAAVVLSVGCSSLKTPATADVAVSKAAVENAAVRSALLELGVARERVAIRGYGESYPVAANDTAQNRQLNRRVEIILSDDSGKITNC